MQFISSIDRNDEIFKQRSFKLGSMIDGVPVIEDVIPIPNSDIVCDWCNKEIITEQVKVIVNFDLLTGKSNVSSAICNNCRENKFGGIIEVK